MYCTDCLEPLVERVLRLVENVFALGGRGLQTEDVLEDVVANTGDEVELMQLVM